MGLLVRTTLGIEDDVLAAAKELARRQGQMVSRLLRAALNGRADQALPAGESTAAVAARLAEACRHPSHAFLPEPISPLQNGLIRWERLLGPRQITDADLLAPALHHDARFATFDQRIATAVVPSAGPAHLCILHDP